LTTRWPYYHQDTSYCARDNGATATSYVQDSYLDHIDYGLVDPNAHATAPDQIAFGVSPRCMSGTCTPLNASTAPNWPDVPFYLYCPTSTSCATPPRAPSFFSTGRLTSITARQWSTTEWPDDIPVPGFRWADPPAWTPIWSPDGTPGHTTPSAMPGSPVHLKHAEVSASADVRTSDLGVFGAIVWGRTLAFKFT
jgi:hypothetical protein